MLHFIITWEIYTEGDEKETLHDLLMDCLDGYNIVQVLSSTFVVKLDEQQEYAELHKEWADIAEEHRGEVEFVMSPLMKAGQYAGYFRQEKWEQLTTELESAETEDNSG